MKPPSRRIQITRSTTLFIIGILGVGHETLVQEADRPTLLLLFAACLGLPAFLASDEKREK